MSIYSDDEPAWRQHFPTYHFEDRDVALEEYRLTAKTLEADERVFLNAANISIVIGAAFGSLALGNLNAITSSLAPYVPELATLFVVLLVSVAAGVIFLRYFADRQKAIVFAGRKLIVLRRMLGMSYGRLQLVLPNWRIEGADEPFALRLFPGWNTYVAYPCYALAGISSVVVFFVGATILSKAFGANHISASLHPLFLAIFLSVAWFVYLCWLYRKALLDTHERTSFLVARTIANILGVRIDDRAEYLIYRANLATHEVHRLGIDLTSLKKMAVQIEDKEFFSHRGVSWKGIARLLLSVMRLGPRSGGSTITQQLARTLFIVDQSKLIRRKLVEILLALWLSKVISKDRVLEMYLVSVRFDYGVMGIAAACSRFLKGPRESAIGNAEAFFLIERLSNVRSLLLGPRVAQTLRRAVYDGVLTAEDAVNTVAIYRRVIDQGLINDQGKYLPELEIEWPAAQQVVAGDV